MKITRRGTLFGAALGMAGFALPSTALACRPPRHTPEQSRLSLIHQMYRGLPGTVLGLKGTEAPRDITAMAARTPGGPLTISLELADKRRVAISWRRSGAAKNPFYLLTQGGLIAKLRLLERGPEESALYGVLLRWEEARAKSCRRSDADFYIQEAISTLDARFGTAPA